jgi:hypothetical protein
MQITLYHIFSLIINDIAILKFKLAKNLITKLAKSFLKNMPTYNLKLMSLLL